MRLGRSKGGQGRRLREYGRPVEFEGRYHLVAFVVADEYIGKRIFRPCASTEHAQNNELGGDALSMESAPGSDVKKRPSLT